MEGNIQTVLDTRGALRCVRFDSGNVGVVTTKGNTKLVVGPFQQLSFAENGFLRVFNGREFFIDMKNGELYAKLSKEHPEGNVILNQQEKTDFEKWLDK